MGILLGTNWHIVIHCSLHCYFIVISLIQSSAQVRFEMFLSVYAMPTSTKNNKFIVGSKQLVRHQLQRGMSIAFFVPNGIQQVRD